MSGESIAAEPAMTGTRRRSAGVRAAPARGRPAGTAGASANQVPAAVVCQALELIGRRWSGSIVRALLSGRTRFTEVAAAIPRMSDRLLSERLKQLEREGIVTRIVIPETPVRIEYRLTRKGKDLAMVFDAVGSWASAWYGGAEEVEPG
jgi:DNA-binding HxlR family transcriptional regulator